MRAGPQAEQTDPDSKNEGELQRHGDRIVSREREQTREPIEFPGQTLVAEHNPFRLPGTARRKDDQRRVREKWPRWRRRGSDRRQPPGPDCEPAPEPTDQSLCRGRGRGDMDRRRHAASQPNPEESGKIERLVRDEQDDRLVRRAYSGPQRRRQIAGGSHHLGRAQHLPAARAGLRSECLQSVERLTPEIFAAAHRREAPGKRASRQASAAFSPSERATFMKASLSGDPGPSISRSMASAASSAWRSPCRSSAWLIARLVSLSRLGSTAERCQATLPTSASSASSGTIRLTIPSSRARSTDNRSSPRKMISFAIFGPTSQGSSITTMPAPNFSSGSPKNAVSLAMVMSQARLSSKAPARHGPRTAAMVGFGQCQNRMTASKSLRRIGFHWSKPVGRSSICSLRSKPEEKA